MAKIRQIHRHLDVIVIGDTYIEEAIRFERIDYSDDIPVVSKPTITRTLCGAHAIGAMSQVLGAEAWVGQFADDSWPKSVRTRHYIGEQCVMIEEDDHRTPDLSDMMLTTGLRIAGEARPKVVVVVDRGAGIVTDEVWWLIQRQVDCPVIVSPYRNKNGEHYGGASCVVTNRHNTCDYSLIERKVVTMDKDGMLIEDEAGRKAYQATHEALDTAGAGDQFLATMAVMIAGGASFRDAAIRANLAAGLQVSKAGRKPVSSKILWDAINRAARDSIGSDHHAITFSSGS